METKLDADLNRWPVEKITLHLSDVHTETSPKKPNEVLGAFTATTYERSGSTYGIRV